MKTILGRLTDECLLTSTSSTLQLSNTPSWRSINHEEFLRGTFTAVQNWVLPTVLSVILQHVTFHHAMMNLFLQQSIMKSGPRTILPVHDWILPTQICNINSWQCIQLRHAKFLQNCSRFSDVCQKLLNNAATSWATNSNKFITKQIFWWGNLIYIIMSFLCVQGTATEENRLNWKTWETIQF